MPNKNKPHRPFITHFIKPMPSKNNLSQHQPTESHFIKSQFKPLPLIIIILVIMLSISQAIQWYSTSITLPRFCHDPEKALHHLEEIINSSHLTTNSRETRRPYIIAAKLIYLIPQQANETNEHYLYRVRIELSQRCLQ
jgi:hypothetical protein